MLCNRIKFEIGINNNEELLETIGEHMREIKKKDVRRYYKMDKPSSLYHYS
jgi:predicted small metal-binding protein